MSNGFDNLQKQLQGVQKNLESLTKKHSVSFDEAFNDSFMKSHTKFSTLDSFWDAAGFKDVSFKDAPQEKLDKFTADNSEFKDFQSMTDAATLEWTNKQVKDIFKR